MPQSSLQKSALTSRCGDLDREVHIAYLVREPTLAGSCMPDGLSAGCLQSRSWQRNLLPPRRLQLVRSVRYTFLYMDKCLGECMPLRTLPTNPTSHLSRPLDEGRELKKRFDDIFSATR
jgi:hypothetical protein